MKKVLIGSLVFLFAISLPISAKAVPKKANWENKIVTSLNGTYQSTTDIAFVHNRFGVVYSDYRNGNSEIYLSLLNRQGKKIKADLNVSNDSGDSMEPTIIWNGRSFGIFWWEHWSAKYAEISINGTLLTAPVFIANGVHISAVWNKKTHEYGVTWWGDAGGGSIPGAVFVRMDRLGNKLSPIIPLNSTVETDYYRPSIAFDGKNYGVAWSDRRGCSGTCSVVAFTIVNQAGVKIIADKAVTTTPEALWTIVWNEHEYAMISSGSSSASLLRVGKTGNVLSFSPLPSNYTIDNAQYFGLLWDKNHYVVSMKSIMPTGPVNADIFVAKYDRFGGAIGDPVKISDSLNHDYFPSRPILAHNSVAVSWIGNLWQPDENITFAQSGQF